MAFEKITEKSSLYNDLDKMSIGELLYSMNQEDQKVPLAVEKALPQVAKAVDAISTAFENGGKLIYIGAGTSGRLGIIDAAECPPTYGVPHELVQGIIAGGKERVFRAGENEEDNYEKGVNDVKDILNKNDILVGISAAGGAKYILAALETAKNIVKILDNKKAIDIGLIKTAYKQDITEHITKKVWANTKN